MGDDAKWMFISAADYEAYCLKPSLKDILEKAEAIGVTDFAAEEKVFNNGAATVEDIHNAVKSLNNKIAELVDPENPVDMTSNIVNPDFNGETISGWTSTTKAQNNCTANNVADDPATNPDKAVSYTHLASLHQHTQRLTTSYRCSIQTLHLVTLQHFLQMVRVSIKTVLRTQSLMLS